MALESDTQSTTLEQMADDVRELINTQRIRKPHVFGHAAGGFVALQFALRHPKLVGGTTLSASSDSRANPICYGRASAPSLTDRAPPTGGGGQNVWWRHFG